MAARRVSLITGVARTALSLLALGFTVWAALALGFRAPSGELWAGLFVAIALLALVRLWRGVGMARALLPLALAGAAVLVWWGSLAPSADRDWATPLQKLPVITIEGDRYTVTNLRHFAWEKAADGVGEGSGEGVREARWETRSYDLSKASGVDLFFSYWTGPKIAHLIVSVTFDDGLPLSFSVEIRRPRGVPFSAIGGFFKSFELAILALDERDVIGLRTHVWREDVRLYRTAISRERARETLLAYAEEINALAASPRWYNTVSANCATVAFRIARRVWPDLQPDLRVVLAGRAPEFAYEIGVLDRSLPFAALQEKAAISARARQLTDQPWDDPGFSVGIRAGVPQPQITALAP
jgi:hypothetical protein